MVLCIVYTICECRFCLSLFDPTIFWRVGRLGGVLLPFQLLLAGDDADAGVLTEFAML